MLPPTEDAFKQHVLRAQLHTSVWCHSHEANPDLMDPVGHGWSRGEDGLLEHKMFEKDCAPIEVRHHSSLLQGRGLQNIGEMSVFDGWSTVHRNVLLYSLPIWSLFHLRVRRQWLWLKVRITVTDIQKTWYMDWGCFRDINYTPNTWPGRCCYDLSEM